MGECPQIDGPNDPKPSRQRHIFGESQTAGPADESLVGDDESTVAYHPSGDHSGASFPRFGDYELLEEIASGGMGVVFLARHSRLNRLCALKMIRGDALSLAAAKRFLAEAQAAAKLRHPHIVPVYEVGRHAERDFFAMAYVEGQSLRERLQDRVFSADDAAGIVYKVARAIDYAHQQGVLHRDIKPGNVILDEQGEPHVTDFGLAKQAQDDTELTTVGQVLGTPSYMPPEQARGDLQQIGPRSDVYSLGALLYALLTGRPPFRADTAANTILQVIGEEPVRPRTIQRNVPVDLETICLKCLEKTPQGRYASAATLADDLQRYRNGEPISARRTSALERAYKWARRRPVTASLLAALSGTIAALAVVCLVSLVLFAGYNRDLRHSNAKLETTLEKLRDEERVAQEQRGQAVENANLATQQRDMALDALRAIVFDMQDALRETPDTLELKQSMLAEAIRRLEAMSQGKLATLRSRRTLAVAYSKLGDIQAASGKASQASQSYHSGLRLLEKIQGEHGGDIRAKRDLATILERIGVLTLWSQRAPNDAIKYFEQSRDILTELLEDRPDDQDVQRALSVQLENLGDSYLRLGKTDTAGQMYRQSLGVRRRINARQSTAQSLRDESVALGKLGELCVRLRQLEEARSYLLDALAIDEKIDQLESSPRSQRDLSVTLIKLGQLQRLSGDIDASRESYTKAIKIREGLARADPGNLHAASDLAIAYDNLGLTCLEGNDVEDAQRWLSQAINIEKQLVEIDGDNLEYQRDLSVSYEHMAGLFMEIGPPATAQDFARKSLEIRQRLAELESQQANAQTQHDLVVALNLLANVLMQMDDAAGAKDHFAEAVQRSRALANSAEYGAMDVARNLIGLGGSYEALSQFADAHAAYLSAKDLLEASGAEDSPEFKHALIRMAACASAME